MSAEYKVALTFEGADRIDIACRADEDVITAALRQGHLLLSDCREGSCATCRGFLVDGDYDQLLPHSPHALTDAEEEDGIVLACRLRPSSDLVIDFDYPADRVGRYEDGTRNGQIVAVDRVADTVARITVRTNAAQDPFQWEPGQYLQITLPAVGATRAYSMANTPDGGRELEFLIKLLADGRFSGHLAADKALGEPVRLRGPYGQFVFRGEPRPVFVAGGTGLAPVLAILRSLAPATEARLVFGAAQESELFALDELRSLRQTLPHLDAVVTVERPTESWSGATGPVTDHLDPIDPTRAYYLCGPPAMISAAELRLLAAGVPRDHIHTERFLETGDQQP
ncbi:2Fe-2S iron-sulfur cluster binding domain-containing protein [Mycolicibacterium pulveris]|uniref:CDP-6-deoxy-delta-3,4-glucoseen reductase n=1 Tax=Mycolicibacterium pulveris TaxID=36813 RepID=A0A7I7UFY7_MYCPV|nr:2Fe-2S iron-sulfur cluster binding domain-containing protein [Mycolicibacterium pulveris]MCV6978808.1 2Fe-2S iron-sulfur cluster binding domain-containing protein [Mycolicibacterium pulveris]BBY79990.1 CDP-6-deoxy-delta-3,4-glucoseen reductase [Mycolicibacterium pulveris]